MRSNAPTRRGSQSLNITLSTQVGLHPGWLGSRKFCLVTLYTFNLMYLNIGNPKYSVRTITSCAALGEM